jgi:hypothetical protein
MGSSARGSEREARRTAGPPLAFTRFPGCTVDQYTMMAVGNYDDNGSATSCTQVNTAYDDAVLMAYQGYAAAAGYPAHDYTVE